MIHSRRSVTEAYAKSTKAPIQDDDRNDSAKQKVRATGKQENSNQKPVPQPDLNDRIIKIESGVAKISVDMNKQ